MAAYLERLQISERCYTINNTMGRITQSITQSITQWTVTPKIGGRGLSHCSFSLIQVMLSKRQKKKEDSYMHAVSSSM